ncbi:Pentatricopeptide repeat-containing protein [Apostasia shenzhenica]|uniref:Pentatricopeptide repeat-containing protein n=1 Tax=Apostasia shenzhenica TaxID=1088818 RepID=A0A2I0AEY1_9ASPA|nr:Pentatricopeptide repeat-containing protein [Apostasia shenzhenica]
MVWSRCSSSLLPLNLCPILPACLCYSPVRFLALTLRCLHRHLGLASHSFLESDSSEFEEVELELNSSSLLPQNHSFPIINRVSYPSRLKVGDSCNRQYSFGRKWFSKKDMMKRIISALSKHGWDLSFDKYDNIGVDYCSCAWMLYDLFEESSDAAVVYYLFRKWQRWDDIFDHKLPLQCSMIHIAASGNMNHIAMKLLRQMIRNYGTDVEGQNLVFDTLWQTRRNHAEVQTVFSMLVLCLAEEGMLDVAAKLTKVMENFGFHPSHGACVSICLMLKSDLYKKSDSICQVLEEMQSWGTKVIELTLSFLIQDLCASGCLDSACKLLNDMPAFSWNANIVTYTMVIDAFCRKGFLKEATSLLFKMTRMGIFPDSASIAVVIDGYCKRGNLELAENLLKFSPSVPDAFVYNSFIFTWCQIGEIEKAHELLGMMLDFGIAPDSVNYTTVIKGYCRLHHLNLALKTFAQMLKRGIQPSIITYTVLIEGLCKNDDIQGAEFIFDALKRDGLQPDIVSYNTLIDGYSKKGYMHKAYEQMDLMKKSGVPPDSATYNIIMHGLVKRGFAIESIFFELVKRGYSPDEIYSPNQIASSSIIHGYSKEGRLEEAYLVWCNISKIGMIPDVVTCSALLQGYCKMHRMYDADVLFHKMLDAGLEPDLILFNTLIRGFCSVKNISKAYQLLMMMKDKGVLPDSSTHSALVVGFEKGGLVNAIERAAMILRWIFS